MKKDWYRLHFVALLSDMKSFMFFWDYLLHFWKKVACYQSLVKSHLKTFQDCSRHRMSIFAHVIRRPRDSLYYLYKIVFVQLQLLVCYAKPNFEIFQQAGEISQTFKKLAKMQKTCAYKYDWNSKNPKKNKGTSSRARIRAKFKHISQRSGQKKLTRIPLVTASEAGSINNAAQRHNRFYFKV